MKQSNFPVAQLSLLTDILVLVKLVVGRMEQVGTRHWKHAETDQPQTQPN